MGVCTSQKNLDKPQKTDITNQPTQLTGQERLPNKPSSKLYMNNRTPRSIQNQQFQVSRTLSSNQVNELRQKKKIGPFDLQKGFFKKYTVLKVEDSILYCENNLTAQQAKVTILEKKSGNNFSFFQQIQQHDLKCTNICQFIESYQEKDQIYIVQEQSKGGNLSQILKKQHLTHQKAVIIIEQIINAVHHLHQQSLSHGSLTIDSFIYSDSDHLLVKLSDLGPVFHYEPPDSNNTLKKQLIQKYKSPENKKNSRADVWSIGVIIYQLFTSEILQIPTSYVDILNWDPLEGLNLSNEQKDGLEAMLQYDSQKRCTLKQIMDIGCFKGEINKETLIYCITQLAQLKKMNNLQSQLIVFMMRTFQSDQVQILSKIFQQGDVDNDGIFNKNELKSLFKHIHLDESFISEIIDPIFQNIDILNKKGLTKDKFIALTSNKKELLVDFNLQNCFKLLSNYQGGITMRSIGRQITLEDELEIREEINDYLYDQLDLDKFTNFMKEVL